MRYEIDSNGFVTFYDVPISRCGVFEYLGNQLPSYLNADPNQVYRVYRPAEAIGNPDTVKSFNQVPWYDKHQMVGDGFAPAESANIQGTTGNDAKFDASSGWLLNSMRLLGSSLKDAVKRGLKQVSCGMKCKYEWAKGFAPDGQAYDIIQTKILGNHIASVPLGRAGDEFAVAMDSAISELESLTKTEGTKDMTIEEILAALKELKPSLDQMKQVQAALGDLGNSEPSDADPVEDQPEPPTVGEDESEGDMPDEKKPDSAMDAAAISKIVNDAVTKATKPLSDKIAKLEGSAMDERAVMKSINERNALGTQLAQVVGQFNYQEKTLDEVAAYGKEKLGIACDSGQEVIAVKAFLQGRQKPAVTIDRGTAQDSADKPNPLKAMGLK